MDNISYTLSSTVSSEILRIETARKNILIEPISPARERELKFENLVSVIHFSLLLCGRNVAASEIVRVLQSRSKNQEASEIIAIHNAYNFMNYYCFLSEKPLEDERLMYLLRILLPGKRIDQDKIKEINQFINASREGGIVQAALSFALLSQILSNEVEGIKVSIILSEAYSMNQGYAFRGLLNLAQFFFSDLLNLKRKMESAKKTKNLSELIEFYVQGFSIQAEKGYSQATSGRVNSSAPSALRKLSERQVKILGLFSFPDAKVSNKTVQKEFGVSQITASRDLSKLAILGLIFQRGQGRSVYYVKI